MTLPPVPDEAWLVFGNGDTCDVEGELWPILYAAALRHAADELLDHEDIGARHQLLDLAHAAERVATGG